MTAKPRSPRRDPSVDRVALWTQVEDHARSQNLASQPGTRDALLELARKGKALK